MVPTTAHYFLMTTASCRGLSQQESIGAQKYLLQPSLSPARFASLLLAGSPSPHCCLTNTAKHKAAPGAWSVWTIFCIGQREGPLSGKQVAAPYNQLPRLLYCLLEG